MGFFFISLYIIFGISTAGEADPLIATAGRVFRVHTAQTRHDKILPLRILRMESGETGGSDMSEKNA